MKLAKTYGFLKKDLDAIEASLHKAIQADHPVLREASIQLLSAGGKRIRPVFVLLCGQFGKNQKNQLTTVAVALELIHMATLVHDDVVDDAELRRNKPTIKYQYSNRVAMYTGDYILARALEYITQLDQLDIHRLLSRTLVEVCIGEIEQIKYKYDWHQQLRNYLRRIKRKTALLIATSCKLGALASGVSKQEAHKLYQYGYNIGMSYQIIDDILDFTSSEKVLGKPTASDLLQGNVTLPVLFAMENETFNTKLQETLGEKGLIKESDFTQLLSMLHETDAIEKSYNVSEQYLNKALKALEKLPNKKPRRALENIARSIGNRKS